MFISRRHALCSTGIAGISLAATTVAGCATYGKPAAAPAAEPAPVPAQPQAPGAPQLAQAVVPALAKTSDIPVGSGLIVGETVITQPAAGKFNGYSAVCTHAGCTVSEVVNGLINCPCHGSRFNLDGTVAKGPAKRPLDPKNISVQGDSIILT